MSPKFDRWHDPKTDAPEQPFGTSAPSAWYQRYMKSDTAVPPLLPLTSDQLLQGSHERSGSEHVTVFPATISDAPSFRLSDPVNGISSTAQADARSPATPAL